MKYTPIKHCQWPHWPFLPTKSFFWGKIRKGKGICTWSRGNWARNYQCVRFSVLDLLPAPSVNSEILLACLNDQCKQDKYRKRWDLDMINKLTSMVKIKFKSSKGSQYDAPGYLYQALGSFWNKKSVRAALRNCETNLCLLGDMRHKESLWIETSAIVERNCWPR